MHLWLCAGQYQCKMVGPNQFWGTQYGLEFQKLSTLLNKFKIKHAVAQSATNYAKKPQINTKLNHNKQNNNNKYQFKIKIKSFSYSLFQLQL